MALLCFPPKSTPLLFSSSSISPALPSISNASSRTGVGFAVFSSHSNPHILKSSRRSRTGRRSPAYGDDEADEDEEDDEEEGEGEEPWPFDVPWPFDDDLLDVEDKFSGTNLTKFYLTEKNKKPGHLLLKMGQEDRSMKNTQSLRLSNGPVMNDEEIVLKKRISKGHQSHLKRSAKGHDLESNAKQNDGNFTKSRFQKLAEELDLQEKWFPLIEYLSTFGLKDSHFISIYERHMPCLQINLSSAKERLDFLMTVGVKHSDIKRIITRQPQILQYSVKNNLKSHVDFLASIGVPQSRIGQIITVAPSLFSYSIEHSLKPTIRYLVEEVGVKSTDVSKVVQLSPQILVQRIDNSWTSRSYFLSKELGAPKDSIVKMVTKHPQLLHYSIEGGILPRINFLRSIGMRNSDILKVLTSLTQVLSLSLEGNLKPKYLYLVNELRNGVKSLTKYPVYLSLSLEQRIRPRHRFLVSLKKAPKGPFPLSSFVPTDECFCQQWAGTSLEKYLTFRQSLQLTGFAKKDERKV